MNNVPKDLYYSDTHGWARLENDGTATLGVTDHAQEAMGDMVFVDLPKVGTTIKVKGECGVLESVKSASDFCSPIAGEIIAINEKLTDTPDLINNDPYGEGWIIKLRLKNPDAVKTDLMDAVNYQKLLDSE